jgi:hypothetical protein
VIFIPPTVVRVYVTVVLKEPFLGWRSNYEGSLKRPWTGGSAPLLCYYASLCITAAQCCQSMNFSNGPRNFIIIFLREFQGEFVTTPTKKGSSQNGYFQDDRIKKTISSAVKRLNILKVERQIKDANTASRNALFPYFIKYIYHCKTI